MRLTADVIVHARASINPCDERELDLRGYKIPMIENLGVTQDQFDAIDFSDNEIKKLDNFPRYKRLSSILLCNNHVSRIAADLGSQLPNLTCIILTNNKLNSLGDLEGLASCKKLTMLSLLHNEVVNKQYYRLYTINLIPSLKQLDFQKVTVSERAAASRLAASKAGQAMIKDVAKEKEKANTFTPGGPAAAENSLTAEHRRIYAERIAAATTVEEVVMLTKKIQAGIIPSAIYKQPAAVANGTAPAAASAAAATAPMDESKDDEEEELEDNTPAVASSEAAEAAEPAAEKSSADGPSAPPVVSVDAAAVSAPGTEATVEEFPAAISAMDVEDGREGEAGRREGEGGVGSDNGEATGGGVPDAMDDGEGEEEVKTVPVVEKATAETGKEEGVEVQEEGGGDGGAETGAGRTASISASDIKKYKVTELKEALAGLSLPTNGLKADLQARLLDAYGHQ